MGDDPKGAAYVFVKPYGSWVDANEDAKLTASDGEASDYFGFSVALSGDTALVGAYGDDDSGTASGSAYIFVKPTYNWATGTETAKLKASDTVIHDQFGLSVALFNDTALIGAVGDDDGGTNSGSAYLFVRPAGGWVTDTETTKLTASDPYLFDGFGNSAALFGDTVLGRGV